MENEQIEFWYARDLMKLLLHRVILLYKLENHAEIRKMLGGRGIKPEDLPPAEDIKKLERRTKTQDKKILEKSGSFSGV